LALFAEAAVANGRCRQKQVTGAMDILRRRFGHGVIGVGRQYPGNL
jgi:hypothetical protein